MSNQLVTPVFYVYKLTFKSGKTYIGCHKQIKERDTYITSSFYYLRHHNEDPLIKREILIEVENQYQMDFLETWCILSDKAYNKDNVNYNLGNFFHRFSTAYHTEEEKRAANEKRKLTMSRKTPEEIRAAVEKQKHTMSLKSAEELADIHRRQGIPGKRPKSEETRKKMSKARTQWIRRLSEEELIEYKKRCSENMSKNITKYFENMSDDDLNRLKQMCKVRELKRWENASKEERLKRCKGFYEAAEERKQKVRCVETNEVFNSAKEAAAWCGPKAKGCNITAQAKGHLHFAYRHPITNEPLHWELVLTK